MRKILPALQLTLVFLLSLTACAAPVTPAAVPTITQVRLPPTLVVGTTVVPESTPTVAPEASLPPDTAEGRFNRMTLEQKIGQVMMVGFDGTQATPELLEMITKYHIGGVILFARNIESPEQVAKLTNALQRAALDSGHPGLFIAIDQEGGRVARLTEDKADDHCGK